MKLIINRNTLIKAMALVIEAVDSRHRLAILGNIKLVLEPDCLTLTASDLEVQLTSRIALPQGACLVAGATTLPAEKFFSICKLLPDEEVCLEMSPEGRCHISSGKSNYTLSSLPAEDYPSIGQPSSQSVIGVELGEFFDLLKHTRFAMATQDVRHYLTGLLLEVQGQTLTAVATDGHRLAVAYRQLAQSHADTKVIIPGKAVSGLERLLLELLKSVKDQTTQSVGLGIDAEFLEVTLQFGDMVINLTARLIEGKFPDFRRVLPTAQDKIAMFDKEEMVSVLRRISVLNTKESPGVLLGFHDAQSATVSSNNREQDEAVETLAVSFTGEPIEVSFNESYFRAVLNVLEGQIRLEMAHPNKPTLIYQVGDEHNHQYVVMPMRV